MENKSETNVCHYKSVADAFAAAGKLTNEAVENNCLLWSIQVSVAMVHLLNASVISAGRPGFLESVDKQMSDIIERNPDIKAEVFGHIRNTTEVVQKEINDALDRGSAVRSFDEFLNALFPGGSPKGGKSDG